MKMIQKFLLPVLALGVSAWTLSAQDAGNPPGPRRGPQDGPGGEGQRPQRRQGGPGMNGQRPPQPPIIAALDLNHDGIIDADEISKASESLKKLDKNGDGNLTPEELRPQRPDGAEGIDGPGRPGARGRDEGRGADDF